MFMPLYVWLIGLSTIIVHSSNALNIPEETLSNQKIYVDDEKISHSFVRTVIGIDEENEEQKKLLLLSLLKKKKFSQNIEIAPKCDDPKLIFTCLNYPKEFLASVKKMQGDIKQLGRFSTDHQSQIYSKGPTVNFGLTFSKISAYAVEYNDPMWNRQSYVQDYRTAPGPVMDLNVVPVYRKGYTGKGVYVAVVDAGVDEKHEDLQDNLMADLCYNTCEDKPGCVMAKKKMFGMEFDEPHGTEVAGTIAMVANNGKGGVGIAYGVKFTDVRNGCESDEVLEHLYPLETADRRKELDQRSDSMSAKALNYKLDLFDIYSNSWGPDDVPGELESVSHLMHKAFMEGISKGRKGKGAIYTFAIGNGKKKGDNCAYDGNVNHIATIGVASVQLDGTPTFFSEQCSAIFTSTYSGSGGINEGIVAPDPGNAMTDTWFGTSASTPIVSGIIALTLQANSELTYRDVKHLVVHASQVAPLANNKNTWEKNAAGYWVSSDFGFGLLNANTMVDLALKWKNVPGLLTCKITAKPATRTTLNVRSRYYLPLNTDACYGSDKNNIYYLEEVQVTPYLKYPARGAISVYLHSPEGTKVPIFKGRSKDLDEEGYLGHTFKAVHFWGEKLKGEWKIEINTSILWRKFKAIWTRPNELEKFEVTFYGTHEKPALYRKSYDPFRLPDGREQLQSSWTG